MPKILPTLLIYIIVVISFLFLFPSVANAQVVINEVFPDPSGSTSEPNEFVELFNTGGEPITITGWTISDTLGAVNTYTIPETILAPGAYVSYRKESTGIALNNRSGDGVELRDSLTNLKNSMSFGSTIEDKSWSRVPNGTGEFVNNTDPSELAENFSPPTPTPTPPPSPTPTPTPTPTPIPTKTPTPTPTKTPTPKPSPKEEIVLESQTSNNDQILGLREQLKTQEPEEEGETIKKKFPIFPVILIILGAGLMGFAGYTLFKKMKTEGYNNQDGENL